MVIITENNQKYVIVLILSYNGKELLQDSIYSYLQNDYCNFEIVVVDNGSTDGTMSWVEQNYSEVYVRRTEKNLKYSGGLNFGMKFAFNEKKADYVLITNNDVVADKNLISSLVETAETYEKTGFTIGKVYYYDSPNVFQTVGKLSNPVSWNGGHIGQKEIDTGQFNDVSERDWCDDIYWLVKREVWEKTGGYDTEFAFQGEDFDWQIRAKKLGYKIMYTPKAKLWHKESMTIGKKSALKAYYDARNTIIIHLKHRNKQQFKIFIRKRIKEIFISTLRSFIIMKWNISIANICGVLSAVIWGIKNRKLYYFI